jgi:hypothetical protein
LEAPFIVHHSECSARQLLGAKRTLTLAMLRRRSWHGLQPPKDGR